MINIYSQSTLSKEDYNVGGPQAIMWGPHKRRYEFLEEKAAVPLDTTIESLSELPDHYFKLKCNLELENYNINSSSNFQSASRHNRPTHSNCNRPQHCVSQSIPHSQSLSLSLLPPSSPSHPLSYWCSYKPWKSQGLNRFKQVKAEWNHSKKWNGLGILWWDQRSWKKRINCRTRSNDLNERGRG